MGKDIFINQQNGVIYENYLWGFNADRNELVKTNLENGRIDFVTSFENMRYEETLFHYIVEYKGKLVLLPGNSDYIVTYQIDSGEKKYYEYKESFSEYVPYQSFWKFSSPVQYSRWLFVFSAKRKYIMKIDLETMDIIYDYKVFTSIPNSDELVLMNTKCFDENVVYVPCMKQNLCLRYDMKANIFDWINIALSSKVNVGFKYMNISNKHLLILTNDNDIVFLNKETYQIENVLHTKGEYGQIATYDNSILLVPYFRNDFVIIDSSGNMRELQYYGDFRFNPGFGESTPTHTQIIQIDDKCYIVPRCSNTLIWFDFQKGKLELKRISIAKQYQEHFFEKFKERNELFLHENYYEGILVNFIRLQTEKRECITGSSMSKEIIGRSIYERV